MKGRLAIGFAIVFVAVSLIVWGAEDSHAWKTATGGDGRVIIEIKKIDDEYEYFHRQVAWEDMYGDGGFADGDPTRIYVPTGMIVKKIVVEEGCSEGCRVRFYGDGVIEIAEIGTKGADADIERDVNNLALALSNGGHTDGGVPTIDTIDEFPDPNAGWSGTGGGGDSGGGGGDECASILTGMCDKDDAEGKALFDLLGLALGILTAGVGILAVIGLVVSSIQYIMSQGDAAKLTKVKSRIFNIVLGILAYGALWAVLNWLMVGGL